MPTRAETTADRGAEPGADAALALLREGTVIPAHPLALTADRKLDERRQRALSRYYLDAGAGGLAVGVHTTQFAIRDAGMFPDVLRIAADTARDWVDRPVALVAGVIGDTRQAVAEASLARDLGYTAALLSLVAWRGRDEKDILEHCRRVARVMPLIGFALLPEVGGFHLSSSFWRAFADIDGVVAIKMAPFNRYRTIDVVRGVVEAHAEDRVTLYTGNDDHIVLDLVQPFAIPRDGELVTVHVKGGLLGHWSVWTHQAVQYFQRLRLATAAESVPFDLLAMDARITDANGAIYDAANDFAGCIPGCLEILRRQGLLDGTWCLNPDETVSPGQLTEIDRVLDVHRDLVDDAFVAAHVARWLDDPAT